jgi:DNA-binding transcriptional regulator YhcF (GntR family)
MITKDELLVTFQKAYQNLELTSLLTPEDVQKFWVAYQTETLERLEQAVLDSKNHRKLGFYRASGLWQINVAGRTESRHGR